VPRGKQSCAAVGTPSEPHVCPCSNAPQGEVAHEKTALEQYDGGVNAVVNDPNGVAEVGKYPSMVEVMLAMACVLPWSDQDDVLVFGEARPVNDSCRASYPGTCLVRTNALRQWVCSGVLDRGS
jgi:hypothetical protein